MKKNKFNACVFFQGAIYTANSWMSAETFFEGAIYKTASWMAAF